MRNNLKIALLRSTNKPFERRIPIYPEDLKLVNPDLRKFIAVETDYSKDFDFPNSYFLDLGYKVEDRKSLLSSADCSFMIRPMPDDLYNMKRSSTSFGWFHCVQNQDIAAAAVANKLTLICMEGLYKENGDYYFKENSRITGIQAVVHALKIANINPVQIHKAVVIGHGNAGIAAIKQLQKLGVSHITCLSRRTELEILNKAPGINYERIVKNKHNSVISTAEGTPLLNLLSEADIIINAISQNIYEPMIFLTKDDLKKLKANALIIDISCDKKMGFEFSAITSLEKPLIYHDHVMYYGVDHLPTLDYDNATKAISTQIIKILPSITEYLATDNAPKFVARALHIKNGELVNPEISYFQQQFNCL